MSLAHSLRTFLPPPRFLDMPSIGVDISDTSLKYIQCIPEHRSKHGFTIAHYGDIDIESGALHRGIVDDPKKLTDALKEMRTRTGIDMVRVSLPEERAYLFETSISRATSSADIIGLLEFRLEENVPLSPRDAYFDYEIIPDPQSSDMVQVLVTVYARETIERYYEACRAADLVPVSFEVEAQAIASSAIPAGDQGTHLIVDFGKTRTGVGIVHNGILMYTSTVELGGSDMSAAMRAILGDVPEKELTTIKNTQGLVYNPEAPELTAAMQNLTDSIAKELMIRIEYWNSKVRSTDDRYIESVVLCGGSANLKGIQRYFSEALGIDAVRADVWQNVFPEQNHVPPISQRYSYGYATAIGLALGAFQ